MPIEGFHALHKIHEGGQAVVYRARRSRDDAAVVLKVLRGPYPSAESLAGFRTEAEITAMVQGPGVIGLLGRHLDGGQPMLVLEDFEAQALAASPSLAPARVVQIALDVVAALAQVHDAGVIHKDINPANIVWRPQDGLVKLIDFGIAATVGRQREALQSPARLRGTLRYIAPEQTGRMNRSVDYRSDYYGLGATLYWLLTGAPPFESDDPLELVHAHVARQPVAVHVRCPEVPENISAVVMKLLAKTAEDRYQSPHGLTADLRRCLAQIEANEPTHAFRAGLHDRPTRVQIPERLYGRDADIEAVVGAVRRSADGAREVLLVSGYSGIGKTSLVNEVHRPMVDSRGVFIRGKCDQYQRGTPYAALAHAFGQFCLGLMTGPAPALAGWRTRISSAVGDGVSALVEVVPELSLVLGDLPPPAVVPAAEAEIRLHVMFQRLVGALAGPDHPLVLFVDDLQWADLPSVRLLEVLASDTAVTHLMVIGAYRDNEVDAAHPLTHAIESLRSRGVSVQAITLEPLRRADVRRFVHDALRSEDDEVEDLAALCYEKTGGNPFFLNQLLLSIEQAGHLRYDPDGDRWTFDLAALATLQLTDNVIDLMTGKIRQLDPAAQQTLAIASMLGNSFRLQELAAVVEAEPAAVERDLRPARAEGLVLRADGLNTRYEFGHDRIQEAAYALLAQGEREALHLRIGRRLQLQAGAAAGEDHIFAVTEHLNQARGLLDAAGRRELAALNLAAGRRASASAAYDAARGHLLMGLALLEPDPFQVDYELACDLQLEAATAAYLVRQFDDADACVDAVLQRTSGVRHKVRALEVRMAARTAQNQLHEAIRTGIQALAMLGIVIPESPDLAQVQAAMGACAARLAGVDLAAVAQGPAVSDPDQLEAARLLMDLAPAAYVVTPMLMPLLATNIIEISVTQGVAPQSSYGFALYGLVLCGAGYLDDGCQLANYGVSLCARFPEARREAARAKHVWMGFTRHWKEPVTDFLPSYTALFHEATDAGDFEYASFIAMVSSFDNYHAGRPLEVLEPELARFTAAMHTFRQEMAFALHGIGHQAVLNLLGQAADPLVLSGAVYDEHAMLPLFRQIGDPTCLFILHVFKTSVAFVLGAYEAAWASAQVAVEFEAAGGTSTMHLPVFRTMYAILALWRSEAGEPLRAVADESRARVDTWAAANPVSFGQKAALLAAEWARADGDPSTAMAAYEASIDGARAAGALNDEAIANELAARFYLQRGQTTIARAFLMEARFAYQRWGARAKEAQLNEAYPELLASVATQSETGGSTTGRNTTGGDLDVAAVVRASQAISQEIVLSELVRTLVTIALEASGARKAVLLLWHDGHFELAAAGFADPEVRIDVPERPDQRMVAEAVPQTVVQYVQRTGFELLLSDAANEGLFVRDPYIQTHGVRSVLALPVSHKGELRAVMYLENDRTAGVFAKERLALSRVLLAQAAISIENAMLYESLEEKVRQRTRDLEQARDEAQRAHARSDEILFNVLPESVAEELKAHGASKPVHVDQASVLFTDFVGFTAVAESLTPEQLVDDLERYFSAFDEIMDRHRLEKLKTIGDAYMAAGGIPRPRATHLVDLILAALDIVDYVERRRTAGTGSGFAARVGIHTGPLVAGVIGRRRFAYDVWGDTVNTASRMESSGAAGRINITQAAYEVARHLFVCEARGDLPVKGKEPMAMYFVNGVLPALSVDGDGRAPNPAFWELAAQVTSTGTVRGRQAPRTSPRARSVNNP